VCYSVSPVRTRNFPSLSGKFQFVRPPLTELILIKYTFIIIYVYFFLKTVDTVSPSALL
jgi:hypothetical protein